MNHPVKSLFFAACLGLAASGCDRRETPVAPRDANTAPASEPAASDKPQAPSTGAAAITDKATVAKPAEEQRATQTQASAPSPTSHTASDIPVQYMAPQLQTILKQYQASEDKDARSGLVIDIANMAGDEVPKPQVAAALGQIFREETSVDVMTDILDELSSLDDPAAFNQIVQGLDRKLPEEVRLAAIDALESLDDQRAIPVLKQLLSDRSQQIREAAKDALDSLSDQ